MAKAQGLTPDMIFRIWKQHGLQPHHVKTFKLSTDPFFVEKLRDIVGLYLNPPDHALILSFDEKTQIQALDRTQPGLPMKKGRCGTMTHDYKRNGTTTLFAALDILNGKVIGECMPRHRSKEFVHFLNRIDRETAAELDLHVVLDDLSAHKSPEVKRWLQRHPRFHFHFTPTSSSWLNLVERWFGEITRKRIRRGVFKSLGDLVAAIEAYLLHNNAHPTPFTWTKDADTILAKIDHCKASAQALYEGHGGRRGRASVAGAVPVPEQRSRGPKPGAVQGLGHGDGRGRPAAAGESESETGRVLARPRPLGGPRASRVTPPRPARAPPGDAPVGAPGGGGWRPRGSPR